MKICSVCNRSWENDFRMCPIDGAPLQEAGASGADPHIGKSIAQCRVVEKLGQGDLGPIYKAEDPIRGVVAIQITGSDRIASPILMEAFGDAVKAATKFNHPQVVRVYGMEPSPDGSVAVLMEYVQGTTLQNYRRARPGMEIAEACRLTRQAAEGVMAAHRISLLHGALHPSRIFVTLEGSVKISGFHRSGLREGADVFTATPVTLPYLAPEQVGIVRDVPAPDYRADVYALGVILYELLAGRLPYEAKNPQELAALMESGPPLPPNFANPHVPPILARVVLKAISKEPPDRHGSMEEFIRELDAAKQTVREAERPRAEYRSEPQYPPPGPDSSLFGSPSGSSKRESVESIWPEAAHAKDTSGEGSLFSWFKTRAGARGSARRPETRSPRSDPEDSNYGGRSSRRGGTEDLEERTVVVSGPVRAKKRRSPSDTFGGLTGRGEDMTGTGALPRRRFSNKAYIVTAAAGVVVLGGLIVLILWLRTPANGKVTLDSTPQGAHVVLIDDGGEIGKTPTRELDLKPGTYRVRLILDGYEPYTAEIEVTENSLISRSYPLVRQQGLLVPPSITPLEPLPPGPTSPLTPSSPQPNRAAQLAAAFNAALRERILFPPSPDNALDILQRWQQAEAGAPSAALVQARDTFCREIEVVGQEKLDQRDFPGARAILDHMRRHNLGSSCAAALAQGYERTVAKSIEELRLSARAAIERQNYVTPEPDNALRYVRLMASIDPQDPEAKSLEPDIFSRAWDQANAKAVARQHQDALEIYMALKRHYNSPPVGVTAIEQAIEKQRQKLQQVGALRKTYSVQVKHNHSRKWLVLGGQECSGQLRVDGFSIEYQGTAHTFKQPYEGLGAVKAEKNKIVIQGNSFQDGKIELEQVEKNPNPGLLEIANKVREFRTLYAEYIR